MTHICARSSATWQTHRARHRQGVRLHELRTSLPRRRRASCFHRGPEQRTKCSRCFLPHFSRRKDGKPRAQAGGIPTGKLLHGAGARGDVDSCQQQRQDTEPVGARAEKRGAVGSLSSVRHNYTRCPMSVCSDLLKQSKASKSLSFLPSRG